jgi:predicted kinase
MLVGVPASGKSTWHHIKYGDYDKNDYIASTDMIIQDIASNYGMTYNEGFKELISFAEKVMWRQITSYLMRGSDFIIDRTNLTAKSRKKFIDKLKLHRYEIECVVFPEVGSKALSHEEWKRRLNSRHGKSIPQEALDRMVNSYEIPLMSEGFSNIIFIENNY